MSATNWQDVAAVAIVVGVALWVVWRWWRKRAAQSDAVACDGCSNEPAGKDDAATREVSMRFHRRKP